MLKHRLIFGTLMAAALIALVVLDGFLDGTLTGSANAAVQGTIVCMLVALMMATGQMEFSRLAAARNIDTLLPVSLTGSVLLAASPWWLQFARIEPAVAIASVLSLSVMGLFLYQALRHGTTAVVANVGGGSLAILYLGLLGWFVPALRIDFGPLPLLMFIFVVKSTDIGAYTFGRLFGKHKFSPKISPGKTWEGMAGGMLAAAIVAFGFVACFDIMQHLAAIAFAVVFAFVGQFGDLAESMIKRDTQKKDASAAVPGFGGVLDVVDSLLISAPLAYLFFLLTVK
jgi:phosphatidate cytidylyltransferase